MRSKRVSVPVGLTIIMILLFFSVVFAYLCAQTTNTILQVIYLLVSMGLVFFSTHPLAHYVVARAYGARVLYFFIAPSDFRRLPQKVARILGSNLPTIGTKLDRVSLSKLSNEKRARIFGAGAISSSVLILIPLVYFIVFSQTAFIAQIFGMSFFIGNLVFELAFSTKVGDLAKMKREYAGIHS